ncbi:M13 family metallopeptidase [Roseivirga sp. BDSF3-8]|uniref:M13 family metallopeptidase n=1 Tax=Roseivirga sp. BDSF3-8 TaxID=3241598 RepID=UPI0035320EC1
MKKFWLKSCMYVALPGMLAIGSACADNDDAGENSAATEPEQEPRGITVSNMDTTANPGEDFYQYANGTWMANNEIPADQNSWGSFYELRDRNQEILLEVLEKAQSDESLAADSDERKAGLFYQVGMDSAKAEELGAKPLQPILDKISAVSNKQELMDMVAWMHIHGLGGMFGEYVYQDMKNSDKMALYLSQGGLGLPDRDYYLSEGTDKQQNRADYEQHIANMLTMAGYDEGKAASAAAEILKLETKMADASMPRVEMRNPDNVYNKMAIGELAGMTPNLNIQQVLNGMGVQDVDSLIVRQPDFFKKLDGLVGSVSLDTWKDYLTWHVTSDMAPYMNNAFVAENFDFYTRKLSGSDEMKPRWKRVMSTTNGALGEALGKLYVAEAFPPEAKKNAAEMVENLKEAFRQRLDNLEWMSEETKEQARTKLESFVVKIGYPDEWEDYSTLEVTEESYAQNVLNASAFAHEQNVQKLGKPVDEKEWGMPPQTVNAYYNPVMNEIVFPAAILQPPFYDYRADAAVNYGGIGAVIGHEITHGFDDQGRRYDAEGNLRDWWTEEDAERFSKLTDRLVQQYGEYIVNDSLNVNGELTLGENIADLGGLAMAYDALQNHLKEHGNPGEIDGYTPEQRFFLAWGQIWRIKDRPETAKQKILIDPHAPGRYRVMGPVSNMPNFYSAFDLDEENITDGDTTMVSIW